MGFGSDAHRMAAASLLRTEAVEINSTIDRATTRVFSRLLTHLTRLFGSDACAGLLARAVHLAGEASPVWAAFPVGAPRKVTVDALAEHLASQSPADAQPAATELLVSFIWLLAAFVGDDIVNRLVRDIWPDQQSAADRVDREESSS